MNAIIFAIAVLFFVVGFAACVLFFCLVECAARRDLRKTKTKIISAKEQRRQSDRRATNNALARVAGLAVEGPTRR